MSVSTDAPGGIASLESSTLTAVSHAISSTVLTMPGMAAQDTSALKIICIVAMV